MRRRRISWSLWSAPPHSMLTSRKYLQSLGLNLCRAPIKALGDYYVHDLPRIQPARASMRITKAFRARIVAKVLLATYPVSGQSGREAKHCGRTMRSCPAVWSSATTIGSMDWSKMLSPKSSAVPCSSSESTTYERPNISRTIYSPIRLM